jgi:hypothetical protein
MEIDKSISSVISQSKGKHYNIVLSKGLFSSAETTLPMPLQGRKII